MKIRVEILPVITFIILTIVSLAYLFNLSNVAPDPKRVYIDEKVKKQ